MSFYRYITDAGQIVSGTFDPARLPLPTTTTIGGVQRNAGSSGQFVNGISEDGALQYGTPAGGGGGGDFLPPYLHVNTQSGNYTADATDSGKLIDFTAAATLSLTAAATLGNEWWCYVRNSIGNAPANIVAIDPDSTETIDALTTQTMYGGEVRMLICTGTAFETVLVRGGMVRFTSSGTFIRPARIQAVNVDVVGGGGGGGGGRGNDNVSVRNPGSGGGGGARNRRLFSADDLGPAGTSITVTVAAQTSAASGGELSDGVSGAVGGFSSFGSFVIAYGGGGGRFGSNVTATTGGSGGGTGSSGATWTTGSTEGGKPGPFVSASQPHASGGGGAAAPAGQDAGSAEFGGGAGGRAFNNNVSALGASGGKSLYGGGGGGRGGNVTHSSAVSIAGEGGLTGSLSGGTVGGGGADGTSGATQSNGSNGADGMAGISGQGGGGGGGNTAGTGGHGGDGGAPGGGGGGGGGGTNTGGNGGCGARGEVTVRYW